MYKNLTIWLLTTGFLFLVTGCAEDPSLFTGSGLATQQSRVPSELTRIAQATASLPPGTIAASGSGSSAPGSTSAAQKGNIPSSTSAHPRAGITQTQGLTTVVAPVESSVQIRKGDKLAIIPPIDGQAWDVSFDPTVVELGTGMDPSHVPTTGLVFIARGTGSTDIHFVTKTWPCDPKTQPCPGIPSYQFSISISVQ